MFRMNRLAFLILCCFIWTTHAQDGDRTTAIGLHTKSRPSSSDTWLTRTVDFPDDVIHFTVCTNIKLLFAYTEKIYIMLINQKTGIMLDGDYFNIYAYERFISVSDNVTPWIWTHICIIIGPDIEFHINGKKMDSIINAGIYNASFAGPNTVNLGLPKNVFNDKMIQSFAGYVTIPHIYAHKLTEEETEKLAKNQDLPQPNLADGEWYVRGTYEDQEIDIANITSNGSMTEVVQLSPNEDIARGFDIIEVDSKDVFLPRSTYKYILLDGPITEKQSRAICEIMNGSLPAVEDEDFVKEMHKRAVANPDIDIMAYVDAEGYNCTKAMFLADSLQPSLYHGKCGDHALYIACKVPTTVFFEFRGNNFPSKGDKFLLIPDGTKIRFFSRNGKEILIRKYMFGLQLEVQSYLTNESLATAMMEENTTPFGRMTFEYKSRDKTLSYQRVLTTCSQDRFTCNNGTCIDLIKRCDGENDCGDDSDENCNILLPLPDSYKINRPHERQTPVDLYINIIKIISVDEDTGALEIRLQIVSAWKDNRVSLLQISNIMDDNNLDPTEVWTPVYWFQNAEFEETLNYQKKINVHQAMQANKTGKGRMHVIDSYEGYKYLAGEDAHLYLDEHAVLSFDCSFDLEHYPFDMHICSANVWIKQMGGYVAYFNTSTLKVEPSNYTLPTFITKPVCLTLGVKEPINNFKIKILLERRFGSYFYTTFLPCTLLGLIGSLTQCFAHDNFSDRIMVTLSCLIVIAALFSQVAVTAPASAQPKDIDIFFFYYMIRLFTTFLHHTTYYLLQEYVKSKKEREEEANKVESIIPITDQTDTDNHQALAPASYDVPVKASLPPQINNAWYHQVKGFEVGETTKSKGKEKKVTVAQVVNVFCITLGYMMDIAWFCYFVFRIDSFRTAKYKQYDEECKTTI